jgi:Flp pilus assembly protein TadD
MPEAPTRFLMQSGALPQLFHGVHDAGYLTWAAHEKYPVFVDGRFEVYGAQFFEEYVKFLAEDWGRFSERHHINVVLVNRLDVGVMASRLAARRDWALVYLDDLHTLWVKHIPEHADLIARYRIDPKTPWTPRSAEPDERLPGWRRALGARPRPWFSMGMVQQFMALRAPDNAAAYLERALAVREDDPQARLLMAQIERLRGHRDRADELMRGLRLSKADQAGGDRILAALLTDAGRDAEAVAPLERAMPHLPDDGSLWAQLAWARSAAGDREGAIQAYRETIRRIPFVADYHVNMGILLHQSGDVRAALTSYREAARLEPGRPDLWTQIGVIHAALGDPAAARECFQKALRLRPGDPLAQQELDKL